MKPPVKAAPIRRQSTSAAGRRVTLADVARLAGVSRVTVSEVLNGRPNTWASETTRQRIRKAAEEAGYRPNLAARALRSGKTHVIGLVSPGFLIYSPRSRAAGLLEAAGKAGYTVTLSSHPNDSDSEDRVIRRMLDGGVDGLAVYPVDPGPHTELRRLVAAGFPVVTFEGANVLDFECDDVSVDCAEVGRLQARHLLDLGRQRVCLANMSTLKSLSRVNEIREDAVRQTLAQAGAPPPLDMRLPSVHAREFPDAEDVERPMRAFLSKRLGEFDAIIGGDPAAAMAIRLLHEASLHVPGDVAVIGGGTTILAGYCEVPLTSVNAENDVAGEMAFGLLANRMGGHADGRPRRLVNPAKLTVRASTRI